jgi:predicted NAD/FAD-binding protein
MAAIPRGQRLAIVGTGIAGLTAAWLLRDEHAITVFEADDRIGGHGHTVDVEADGGRHAVDTGFMVYNEASYPLFTRLLRHLGVATDPTRLSFSVQIARTGLEYGSASPGALFAQRSNLMRPSFHRMLLDMARFAREAPGLLRGAGTGTAAATATATAGDAAGPGPTLGQFLAARRYSPAFIQNYIVPVGAALWSAVPRRLLDAPALPFVTFMHHHGFLIPGMRRGWRVIRGGARRYVEPLAAPFRDRVRLKTPVRRVRRRAGGVEIATDAGTERFDAVILAAHSDQSLALLADPSPDERDALGAIPFQANDVAVHNDPALLPRRRAAWSAVNYRAPEGDGGPAQVTYLMNAVHGRRTANPLCVTLNRMLAVDSDRLLRRLVHHHPVFTAAAPAAQRRLAAINGRDRTYYCGAWTGDGFQEDGVASAVAVGRLLGRDLPN